MHAEQIKAAIRMKGTTPAAIAEALGVSRSMVSHVINGRAKSAHIAERISKITGHPITVLWPATPQKAPLRRSKVTTSAVATA